MARTVLLVGLALLAIPASASAVVQVTVGAPGPLPDGTSPAAAIIVMGTGDPDQATLTFEPNSLHLTDDDRLRVTSASAPLTDSATNDACAPDPADQTNGYVLVCDVSQVGLDDWVVLGNGGNDDLRVEGPPQPARYDVWMAGGAGDDVLVGGPGVQHLYGESWDAATIDCHDPVTNPLGAVDCDDEIRDGLGRDVVVGGGGSDRVVQSPLGTAAPDADRDTIDLGAGSADAITWAGRPATARVVVRAPGSGAAGGSGTSFEEDAIADGVERFTGSQGDDEFRPSSSAVSRTFDGGAGADSFWPSSSPESLVGGPGVDSVRWDAPGAFTGVTSTANGVADDGPAGAHHVGADIERMYGSAGTDVLLGSPVAGCRVSGGAGADTVIAPASGCVLEGGDGSDTISGGPGDDVVRGGAASTTTPDAISFGAGSDTVDYAGAMLIGGASSVIGVQASRTQAAAVWCYGLGLSGVAARKYVAGQAHLETWADAPEHVVGTVAADTLCAGPGGGRLDGGDGADVLVGHVGADLLVGGAGDDLLNGQGGPDVLDGGPGDDNLNGGAGSDVVDGGPGNDPHVRGGGGSDTIRGGEGNDVLDEMAFSTVLQGEPATELDGPDVLDGGPGVDVIDGNAGDDVIACTAELLADQVSDSGGGVEVLDCSAMGGPLTYAAGAGIDRVVGSPFGDVLSGAPDLVGGGGDDVLSGTGGGTLDGGPGNDQLAAAGGALLGGPGNDVLDGPGATRIDGGDGDDVVRGGGAAETLEGGPGDDRLEGGAGDDVLVGGAGGDVLLGGAGADVVSYSGRGGGVSVSRGGGADDGQPGERDDVGSDVELVVGTGFADTLATGSTPATLRGEGGDDVLLGSPGTDDLDGGGGNDRVVSGGGSDVLRGGDGNDQLLGGAGADQLHGDGGADMLDGGLGPDRLSGGAGVDAATWATRGRPVTVTIGSSRPDDGERGELDHVLGDVENAVGGRSNDRLVGSARPNLLRGGAGRDRLDGGAGNDRLFGGPGHDQLLGGAGNDQLRGEAGNDVLDARDRRPAFHRRFRELVDGGAGRDTVYRDARDRLLRVEVRRKAPLRKVMRRPSRR